METEKDRIAKVNAKLLESLQVLFGSDVVVAAAFTNNYETVETASLHVGENSKRNYLQLDCSGIYMRLANGKLVEINTSEWANILDAGRVE